MEPLHLKSDELNYELAIRGIFNVESQRLKTSKLRELLKGESEGILVAPTDSSHLHAAPVEIEICQIIYKNIIQLIEQGDKTEITLKPCASRLRHLGQRINRIQTTAGTQEANVLDLGHCVSDALMKVEGHRNETVDNHIASNAAISLETNSELQLGAQALPQVLDNMSNTIPQNSNTHDFIDLVDHDEMCDVDRRYSYFDATAHNLAEPPSNFREKTSSFPNVSVTRRHGRSSLNPNAFNFQPSVWAQNQTFDAAVGSHSKHANQTRHSDRHASTSNPVQVNTLQSGHQSLPKQPASQRTTATADTVGAGTRSTIHNELPSNRNIH